MSVLATTAAGRIPRGTSNRPCSTTYATATETTTTMARATAPAAQRLALLASAWFKLASSHPISRPIQVTGCPIAPTRRSGYPTTASISSARKVSVTQSPDIGLACLQHGGDLAAARRRFPGAPEPLIDLSTGINPHSYPLPQLSSEVFARLPEPAALERLAATAARAYGASPDQVAAAPGTQILLPPIFALVPGGRAAVLGPTYAEHVRVAKLVDHETMEATAIEDLTGADLAVIVNPNNPDGRIVSKDTLLALAEEKQRHGGLLVVDEAFADVGPAGLSLGPEVGRGNLFVLRSFGKFHGLAGLRLGFALAAPELAARLRATLG